MSEGGEDNQRRRRIMDRILSGRYFSLYKLVARCQVLIGIAHTPERLAER